MLDRCLGCDALQTHGFGEEREPLRLVRKMRDDAAAPSPVVDRMERIAHRPFGGRLRRKVERRVDVEAFGQRRGGSEQATDLPAHFGQIRETHVGAGRFFDRKHDGLLCKAPRIGERDVAFLDHATEHVAAPRDRTLRMLVRRVARGRGHQACEHRGLARVELGRRLAEVVESGSFNSVISRAEVNVVDVQLEQLLLGELALETQCENGFAHLTNVASLVAREQVLDDLLRDRRTTLVHTALHVVACERTNDTGGIDAAMCKKPAIFGCDERLPDVVRKILDRNPDAALDVEFVDRSTGYIVDDAVRRRSVRLNVREIFGKCGKNVLIEPARTPYCTGDAGDHADE